MASRDLATARAALDPLPAGYRELLDRIVEAVTADDVVRALWLGGSLARGDADAGSDLDLLLTIRDDALPTFADGWREWLESVTPVLLCSELPGHPGSFFATTEECLRLDVIVETVSMLPETPFRQRRVVLDRDGVAKSLPEPVAPERLSHERIWATVEEFYRQQVIFPAAVVARRDWLLGVVGVHHTQLMLYDLFVATNDPLPPMGIKQWSSRLTESQRELLASLPSPQAHRQSVIAAMQAVRRVFRTTGRNAALAAGCRWPDHVDDAVARYWATSGL